MTLAEYEHMKKVCDYVFSAPPNSAERERRLAQISEKDNERLWDFYSGLCSGRIKRPESQTKKSEVCDMEQKKKIENYEDFKKALTKSSCYQTLVELKQSSPDRYKYYQERLEKEKAR
ncbi:MAG: hypothetical protein HDR12_13970 [Lachnospiraceae bacterium]|nr:hypothetical protein [Lachnospiraceae bacterium]